MTTAPELTIPGSEQTRLDVEETHAAATSGTSTVYDRVGGYEGFLAIARDILVLHHANPLLELRYGHARKSDEQLAVLVAELLSSVTGGSETYTGMDMLTAHTGMSVHA